LTSALFLSILYYYNSPSGPYEGYTGNTPTDELLKQIDSLSKASYQDPLYSQIKLDVIGMNSAGELSDEEKDGLISSLEIAKMKSLIKSYDEVKNANCMNVGGLAKWSTLLKQQQKIVPNLDAKNRISAFSNLSAFMRQKGMVAGFLQGEFNQGRYDVLKGRISQLAISTGVRECSTCNRIKSDLIDQLERFKAAFVDFSNIVNGVNPCSIDLQDNFIKYNFYYLNFPCQ
jgi:hypothetical protein